MATAGVDEIYHLAADMGGIGYITALHAQIARNDTMMNVHMLDAARVNGAERFLFSSSACVYPQYLQRDADVTPLKEDDAFPADPEEGYGLEKLFMEKLCQYYHEDWGLETRRSEEHTSELQSLMRNSYAVFCLKKKRNNETITQLTNHK